MIIRELRWIAVFGMALFLVSNGLANLVTNGSFETGDYTGWTQSGDTGFTYVVGGSGYHSGRYASWSGPFEMGYLSQTLNTLSGQSYILDFWMKSEQQPMQFVVWWDHNKLLSLENFTSNDYQHFSCTVIGTGADTLTFGSQNGPDYVKLDDVSVTAVPESASLLVDAFVLLPLAVQIVRVHSRRRNAQAKY